MDANKLGRLKGIRVCQFFYLTRLLFMDDLLCFTNGSMLEGRVLKYILNLYCNVTRMEVNVDRSMLCFNGVPERVE
jgi:hypothetical protein